LTINQKTAIVHEKHERREIKQEIALAWPLTNRASIRSKEFFENFASFRKAECLLTSFRVFRAFRGQRFFPGLLK